MFARFFKERKLVSALVVRSWITPCLAHYLQAIEYSLAVIIVQVSCGFAQVAELMLRLQVGAHIHFAKSKWPRVSHSASRQTCKQQDDERGACRESMFAGMCRGGSCRATLQNATPCIMLCPSEENL